MCSDHVRYLALHSVIESIASLLGRLQRRLSGFDQMVEAFDHIMDLRLAPQIHTYAMIRTAI